MNTPIQMR